jgi:hypothetical protein
VVTNIICYVLLINLSLIYWTDSIVFTTGSLQRFTVIDQAMYMVILYNLVNQVMYNVILLT